MVSEWLIINQIVHFGVRVICLLHRATGHGHGREWYSTIGVQSKILNAKLLKTGVLPMCMVRLSRQKSLTDCWVRKYMVY